MDAVYANMAAIDTATSAHTAPRRPAPDTTITLTGTPTHIDQWGKLQVSTTDANTISAARARGIAMRQLGAETLLRLNINAEHKSDVVRDAGLPCRIVVGMHRWQDRWVPWYRSHTMQKNTASHR